MLPEPAPERLHRVVASEWPGGVEDYTHAAFAWLREDPDRRVEYGDALEVLQWSYKYRMARWRGGE